MTRTSQSEPHFCALAPHSKFFSVNCTVQTPVCPRPHAVDKYVRFGSVGWFPYLILLHLERGDYLRELVNNMQGTLPGLCTYVQSVPEGLGLKPSLSGFSALKKTELWTEEEGHDSTRWKNDWKQKLKAAISCYQARGDRLIRSDSIASCGEPQK